MLLATPLQATLYYDGDFILKAGVSFLQFRIWPDFEADLESDKLTAAQKRRLLKRIRRSEKKAEKKAERKQRKKAKKEKDLSADTAKKAKGLHKKKLGKGKGLLRDINYLTRLFRAVSAKLGKKLAVQVNYLHISVATGDAANTAYLYGAVSQSVSYLLTAVATLSRLKMKTDALSINADFLGEKTVVKGKVTMRVAMVGALSLLISALSFTVKDTVKNNLHKP